MLRSSLLAHGKAKEQAAHASRHRACCRLRRRPRCVRSEVLLSRLRQGSLRPRRRNMPRRIEGRTNAPKRALAVSPQSHQSLSGLNYLTTTRRPAPPARQAAAAPHPPLLHQPDIAVRTRRLCFKAGLDFAAHRTALKPAASAAGDLSALAAVQRARHMVD